MFWSRIIITIYIYCYYYYCCNVIIFNMYNDNNITSIDFLPKAICTACNSKRKEILKLYTTYAHNSRFYRYTILIYINKQIEYSFTLPNEDRKLNDSVGCYYRNYYYYTSSPKCGQCLSIYMYIILARNFRHYGRLLCNVIVSLGQPSYDLFHPDHLIPR